MDYWNFFRKTKEQRSSLNKVVLAEVIRLRSCDVSVHYEIMLETGVYFRFISQDNMKTKFHDYPTSRKSAGKGLGLNAICTGILKKTREMRYQ